MSLTADKAVGKLSISTVLVSVRVLVIDVSLSMGVGEISVSCILPWKVKHLGHLLFLWHCYPSLK